MTDQNTAYRADPEPEVQDDPLAELARIVSGEVDPKPQVADTAGSGSAPAVSSPAGSSPAAPTAVPADQGIDIESELLKELGGDAVSANVAPAAEAPQFELNEADFAAELSAATAEEVSGLQEELTTESPVAESAPLASDGVSLEDQLMAELTAEGDTDIAVSVEPVDPAVDQTVSNAMRDVEMASAETHAHQDAFAQVDHAAAALHSEAVAATQDQDVSVDNLFEEGFQEILQDEIATREESGEKAGEAAESQNVVGEAGTNNMVSQLDFAEAFNAEIAADSSSVPADDGGGQTELALENEFAKSFADELADSSDPIAVDNPPDTAAVPAQLDPFVDPVYQGAAGPGVDVPEDAQLAGLAAGEVQKSGGGFKLAVGTLGAALVLGLGVVGWGYFSQSGGSGEPVIVRADSEPAKVKPEQPGGEQIANQDNQVYNKVAGNATGEPKQEALITSRQQAVDVQTKSEPRLTPQAETASNASAPLGLSPKRVKTMTVKPDGTIIPASDNIIADNSNSSSTIQTTSPAPETASLSPIASTTGNAAQTGSIAIDGAVSTGRLPLPAQSPLPAARQLAFAPAPAAPKPAAAQPVAPKPAAAAPKPKPVVQARPAPVADSNAPTQIASFDNDQARVPQVTSSEWKIQVSSQRSRDAAEASFRNLQRRFNSVLGGRTAFIQRADIEGKGTFYRAKVPAASRAEATRLCSRLKAAGGNCFVTR